MADVVVTVPLPMWDEWIAEGDLPGDAWTGMTSHFWFWSAMPDIRIGERVYVVAHGKLRGYAPLWDRHLSCPLRPRAKCLMRRGGAVAVTIPEPIRGFRGWRYRWWNTAIELRFPDWRTP